mmetsp:Transcript_55765/g.88388  ORF Transcript_55765/g.88388 Transcript_55765/m.88388 type:complete len:125 (-) Transcript_55765:64-438(-)|eukprot:CAMPEP_0169112080 /NCGR_PEP_ID=MMETSP1015-20121227/27436_1 /TAXON_ID=342587 /ORGANISM="Karlodinium micrum, Strain CCMP2283" /LENGTH=124 /DNA_ID=CAMNT_0009174077 /DNA_START=79 /DNA_END=453 /DNA_ORIENTATION=-
MGYGKAKGKGKGKGDGPYGGGGEREQKDDSLKAYVGNLSFRTQFGRLKDHIRETAGVEVAFVKIMTDASKGYGKHGRPFSKGRGVIEFNSAEDAQTAIAACNGTELDGREIELDSWETGWTKPE